MKLSKKTIALLIALALLIAVYAVMALTHKKTEGTEGTNQLKVVSFNTSDMKKIAIENKENTFVLDKKDDSWIVSSPAGFKAIQDSITRIASNISAVTADKLIDENATDLAQFGLDKPAQVTVEVKDGTQKTLQIGSQSPTYSGYYVKLKDSNKVYLVSTYVAESFLLTKENFRDKTLFTMPADNLISITVSKKGLEIFKVQKNKKAVWEMLKPLTGEMNSETMNHVLETITSTTVKDYVEDNPTDLAKYGLDNPAYVFECATANTKIKILLGNEKVKDSEIYAKMEGRNEVFTIDETPYDLIDKPAKEFLK